MYVCMYLSICSYKLKTSVVFLHMSCSCCAWEVYSECLFACINILRHAKTCFAHTPPCLFVVVGLCADQSLLRSAYLQLWGVCGRAGGFVCASRGPDGLLREGNNEARWISGSRVGRLAEWDWSVGSRHRPQLSHIPHWRDLHRPCSWTQRLFVCDTHREREESYYGTRAFIPLNDERVCGGMKASHSLNYQCHLSGWVTVEKCESRSWRKQQVSLQKTSGIWCPLILLMIWV